MGLLSEAEQSLDYILSLGVERFLDRRLQTRVFKSRMATSIHHARCLIKQRHIRVGRRVVDAASFMVHVDSEKHIEIRADSPYSPSGGKKGRVARKNAKKNAAANDSEEESD